MARHTSLFEIQPASNIVDIHFTKSFLVILSNPTTVTVHDLTCAHRLPSADCEHTYTLRNENVRCIATTYNLLATGHDDGLVKVRDMKTRRLTLNLKRHECPVTAIHFLDDGKIVSGDHQGDVNVWAWHRRMGRLKGHEGKIVNFVSYKETLVSVDLDETCRIWDIEEFVCKKVLKPDGELSGISDILLKGDGSLLALVSVDGSFGVWCVKEGCWLFRRKGERDIFTVMYKHGDRLMALDAVGSLMVFDWSTGLALATRKHIGDISRGYVSLGQDLLTVNQGGYVKVWWVEDGRRPIFFGTLCQGHHGNIHRIVGSENGDLMALVLKDEQRNALAVQVWNAEEVIIQTERDEMILC